MSEEVGKVGIVGLGSLGSKMTRQFLGSNWAVDGFDIDGIKPVEPGPGVDPALTVGDLANFHRTKSINEIIYGAGLNAVHICTNSRNLGEIFKSETAMPDRITFLHDSVMHVGRTALGQLDKETQERFVQVHCLMNEDRRIIVSNVAAHALEAQNHFEKIGLSVTLMNPNEHDRLMARTQGMPALLIALGFKDIADAAAASGNLTPSGSDLQQFLHKRALKWTPETLKTILDNPELEHLLNEFGVESLRQAIQKL